MTSNCQDLKRRLTAIEEEPVQAKIIDNNTTNQKLDQILEALATPKSPPVANHPPSSPSPSSTSLSTSHNTTSQSQTSQSSTEPPHATTSDRNPNFPPPPTIPTPTTAAYSAVAKRKNTPTSKRAQNTKNKPVTLMEVSDFSKIKDDPLYQKLMNGARYHQQPNELCTAPYSASPHTVNIPQPANPKIKLFGTSNMHLTSHLLFNTIPNVTIHAKSGATFSSMTEDVEEELKNGPSDIIILSGGTNEASSLDDLNQAVPSIHKLIQAAKSACKCVILMSPPPLNSPHMKERVTEITHLMSKAASQENIGFVKATIPSTITEHTTRRDGIHVTSLGAGFYGQSLLHYLGIHHRNIRLVGPVCVRCHRTKHTMENCPSHRYKNNPTHHYTR